VPEFEVELVQNRIARIGVRRGAPCGATWEAAARVANLPVDEALACIGLQTQYFCAADPAGWDPIYGQSPVHLAAEIHRKALMRGLKKSCSG
jgi:hypothetical protein